MITVAEKRRISELQNTKQGNVRSRRSNDQRRVANERKRHSSPGPSASRRTRAARSGMNLLCDTVILQFGLIISNLLWVFSRITVYPRISPTSE